MPALQKSAVNFDIHAHTFKALAPDNTLKNQSPNSCAILCHREDFNIADWTEGEDILTAEYLASPADAMGGYSRNWYFAEGSTQNDRETFLLLSNNSAQDAELEITYLFESGAPYTLNRTVGANSRLTVNAASLPRLAGKNFGMVVETDGLAKIIAERAMYWETGGLARGAGTNSPGVQRPAMRWVFAEGSNSNGRRTKILVINPDTLEPAEIRVTFADQEGGSPVEVDLEVGPQSRLTIDTPLYIGARDFSTQIESLNEVGVVAERTLTSPGGGTEDIAGTNSPGVPRGYRNWFLAEGATHGPFEEFILFGNFNDEPADISIEYLLDGGGTVMQNVAVAAQSRVTVKVDNVPGMESTPHGTRIQSDQPVIVERAMYWTTSDGITRGGGHNTPGSPVADLEWYLAEGRTGGLSEFEEFILLANSDIRPADVVLTYQLEDGTNIDQVVTIPGSSRRTIKVNDAPGLGDVSHSTRIVSNIPINVERAMYWTSGPVYRVDGHASLAIPKITAPTLTGGGFGVTALGEGANAETAIPKMHLPKGFLKK